MNRGLVHRTFSRRTSVTSRVISLLPPLLHPQLQALHSHLLAACLYPLNEQEDGDCGVLIEHLCPEGELGCGRDADGGYDVTMPEPLGGVSGSGYRVRITQVGYSPERVRCSDNFYLVSADELPVLGYGEGPSIAVVSPTADSVAVAGNEYTVEVRGGEKRGHEKTSNNQPTIFA